MPAPTQATANGNDHDSLDSVDFANAIITFSSLSPSTLYPHPISLALSPAISGQLARAGIYPAIRGGAPRLGLIGNGPIFGISAHSLRDPPSPPTATPRFTAPRSARSSAGSPASAAARARSHLGAACPFSSIRRVGCATSGGLIRVRRATLVTSLFPGNVNRAYCGTSSSGRSTERSRIRARLLCCSLCSR